MIEKWRRGVLLEMEMDVILGHEGYSRINSRKKMIQATKLCFAKFFYPWKLADIFKAENFDC